MKKSCLIKFGIVLSICSVLGTGCAVGVRGPGGEVAVSTDPGVVYADSEPPPAYAETVTGSLGLGRRALGASATRGNAFRAASLRVSGWQARVCARGVEVGAEIKNEELGIGQRPRG